MSFVAKAFGAGKQQTGTDAAAQQIAAQNAERLETLEAENLRQRQLVDEEKARADKVAAAQRRILGGRTRGLLRYAEPSTDVLGASSA
jgi:hypothetical protein